MSGQFCTLAMFCKQANVLELKIDLNVLQCFLKDNKCEGNFLSSLSHLFTAKLVLLFLLFLQVGNYSRIQT